MTKSSKKKQVCAGVDVGKTSLSYAVAGASGAGACMNTASARKQMIAHFSRAGATRVGMESTGAYHFAAAEELREARFEVLVFQPMQVKAYAKFRLKRAKSDPIDAALIARCAEDADDPPAQSDPRLIASAERLTFIDQVSEDIARARRADRADLAHPHAGTRKPHARGGRQPDRRSALRPRLRAGQGAAADKRRGGARSHELVSRRPGRRSSLESRPHRLLRPPNGQRQAARPRHHGLRTKAHHLRKHNPRRRPALGD